MALIVFPVVLGLGFAAILGMAAVMLRNGIRTHRAGILRPTGLQKSMMWLLLLTLTVHAAMMSYFLIGDPGETAFPHFVAAVFITFGVLFFMMVAANRQQSRAQQVRDREARVLFDQIRAGHSIERPLFVYLRPFSAGGARNATEILIIELLEQRGALLCVDEPGFQYGIGRVALRDDEWQEAVLRMCERATAVVIYPAATAGTFWELLQLASRGWLDRAIFVMPPHVIESGPHEVQVTHGSRGRTQYWDVSTLSAEARRQLDPRHRWEQVRARAAPLGVALPEYRNKGGLFRITTGGVDWITVFDRDLWGKAPTRAVEALAPVIDRLITTWQSTRSAVTAGARADPQVPPHASPGAP
jgi:hypothetical protein